MHLTSVNHSTERQHLLLKVACAQLRGRRIKLLKGDRATPRGKRYEMILSSHIIETTIYHRGAGAPEIRNTTNLARPKTVSYSQTAASRQVTRKWKSGDRILAQQRAITINNCRQSNIWKSRPLILARLDEVRQTASDQCIALMPVSTTAKL